MDIKETAQLAGLNLSQRELQDIERHQLKVLEAFASLQKLDTSGVEPLITPIKLNQRLREDKVQVWEQANEALDQAPVKVGNLFKVPPVV